MGTEISKKKLAKIYYENSLEKAAKDLQISVPTLLKYVKGAGIKLKRKKGISKLKIV